MRVQNQTNPAPGLGFSQGRDVSHQLTKDHCGSDDDRHRERSTPEEVKEHQDCDRGEGESNEECGELHFIDDAADRGHTRTFGEGV